MVKLISLFPSFHPTRSPHVRWNSKPAGSWKETHLQGRSAELHVILSHPPTPASFPLGLLILLLGMRLAVSQGGKVFLLCITMHTGSPLSFGSCFPPA